MLLALVRASPPVGAIRVVRVLAEDHLINLSVSTSGKKLWFPIVLVLEAPFDVAAAVVVKFNYSHLFSRDTLFVSILAVICLRDKRSAYLPRLEQIVQLGFNR